MNIQHGILNDEGEKGEKAEGILEVEVGGFGIVNGELWGECLRVMLPKFTYWEDGDFFLGYLNEYPDYWTRGSDLEDLKDIT